MRRSTMSLRAVVTAAGVLCASMSAGQAPQKPAAPAPATPPAAAPASPAPPATPEGYTYNPDGRRDPFVSLVFRGNDLKTPAREARPSGLQGLLISEITLRGIVKDRTGYVAMVSGPDNKTHIVHTNDKVFDGTVKAIAPDSVIFSQDVNDPLSLVKQREVRKYLRATQEGK